MSKELVMLVDRVPTTDEWTAAATELFGGGSLREWIGDLCQLMDPDGEHVLSWWAPRPLEATRTAAAMLGSAPTSRYWVDIVLPYGDGIRGRQLAEAVARAVGGRVVEPARG